MITEHNHHDAHHVQTAGRPPATIEAERLAGFVRTQTASATPQRIVESLTTLVSTEVLTEGTRLPTVRALAETLHVSPATVSSAYHMLARSGVVRSRGRAGTFVLPQALSEVTAPPTSAIFTNSTANSPIGATWMTTHSSTADSAVPSQAQRTDNPTAGVRETSSRSRSRADGIPAAAHIPVIDLSRGTPDNTLLPTIRPYLARLGNRRAFVNSYTGPTILPMLEEELRADWPYDPQAMTMVSGAETDWRSPSPHSSGMVMSWSSNRLHTPSFLTCCASAGRLPSACRSMRKVWIRNACLTCWNGSALLAGHRMIQGDVSA